MTVCDFDVDHFAEAGGIHQGETGKQHFGSRLGDPTLLAGRNVAQRHHPGGQPRRSWDIGMILG